MDILNALDNLRIKQHITHEYIAEKIGMTYQDYSNTIVGDNCTLDFIIRYANAIDYEPIIYFKKIAKNQASVPPKAVAEVGILVIVRNLIKKLFML